MKELQPINQQVILEVAESDAEQRTSSGIIIPDVAKEKSNAATIIWMSAIENAEVKPGDVVLYKPFSGTEMEFDSKKYLILPYADIFARVVETEAI